MSHPLIEITVARIEMTHRLLRQVTDDLSEAQFAWTPGPEAPPIGWHLWHIARWADRLQASFPATSDEPGVQIWEAERLASAWALEPSTLGVLQTGAGMDPHVAAPLVREVGQARILEYARRSFSACDNSVAGLQPEDLEATRESILALRIEAGRRIVEAQPQKTTVAGDLAYHFSHASRHLGMIEGLRGAQGLFGTASF